MKNNERILSLAKEAEQSGRAVKYILDLMDAHPDLIDLPRISMGLIKALNASEVEPKFSFDGIDKAVLLSTCKWIASLGAQPNIEALFGKSFWLGNPPPIRNPVLNQGVKKLDFLTQLSGMRLAILKMSKTTIDCLRSCYLFFSDEIQIGSNRSGTLFF